MLNWRHGAQKGQIRVNLKQDHYDKDGQVSFSLIQLVFT